MSRIIIELPVRFGFSTQITLLGTHINFGGHLDNAMLLTLVSEARMRLWEALGYADLLDIRGVYGVVADTAIQYVSEAHRGETMCIELAPRDFGARGFDFIWRVSENLSKREVARGKTGIVMVDSKTRRVALLPERVLQQLQNL